MICPGWLAKSGSVDGQKRLVTHPCPFPPPVPPVDGSDELSVGGPDELPVGGPKTPAVVAVGVEFS